MLRDSIKVDLVFKNNPSIFIVKNAEMIGTISQHLGSTHSAVNKMLVENEKMLKVLMPSLINVLPTDVTWYTKTASYWHGFSLDVPIGGVTLEIGFEYDLRDRERSAYIKDIISREKEITSDEKFKAYLSTTKDVAELDKYLYAKPINVKDYLTWVYCLGHKEVANTVDSVNKSENIRFTLIDQRQILEQRRNTHSISLEAIKRYLEVLANREMVRDMLYSLGYDANTLQDIDADSTLKTIADTQPKRFLDVANDKNLNIRGRIERYVIRGVLNRLPNSNVIVDNSDSSCVIGSSLEEAIAYFNAESSEQSKKVNEFKAKYAALTKK